jgi:hypothetical protein
MLKRTIEIELEEAIIIAEMIVEMTVEMTAEMTKIVTEIAGTMIEIIKIIEIKNTIDVIMITCTTEIVIDKVVVIIHTSLHQVTMVITVTLECIRISNISSLHF